MAGQHHAHDGAHSHAETSHAETSHVDADHDGAHGHAGTRVTNEDELAAELRARGMRVTPQRGQVLAAVRDLGHATPEQISESVPGVDVTTVYRNLELLEELGFVRHAHLGHGAPSYRPADDEHIHIVCHVCGSVVDAEPDLVDELADRLAAGIGFTLDRSHFTVFGRCQNCAGDDREEQLGAAEQTNAAKR
jgi:Fur family ferric uptake transcriptional regulator